MRRFATLLLLTWMSVACTTTTTEKGASQQGSKAERIEAWNNLARKYIQLEQYDEAKRPLKQALKVDERAGESLALLALVFQNQQEIEIAESYYQKALESAPDNPMINNNYGIFLMLQQRYDQACDYLADASSNPLYAQRTAALENLANCYRLNGDLDRAEEVYRRVLRLDPNSAQAILELAVITYARGEYNEARGLFERFSRLVNLRRAEHNAKSLWLGIQLARRGTDPSRAATYALLLKNLFPDSREYQLYKESRP